MGDGTADGPRRDDARTALSVPDAARRLGVTPGAVRSRLHRGTLAGEKRGGQWVVFLPPADDVGEPTGTRGDPTVGQQDTDGTATAALIANLQRENARLWEELAERAEEIRRRDHIIAGLVQRVPELPSGQDAPATHQNRPGATEPTRSASDALMLRWRRWLRRVRGG